MVVVGRIVFTLNAGCNVISFHYLRLIFLELKGSGPETMMCPYCGGERPQNPDDCPNCGENPPQPSPKPKSKREFMLRSTWVRYDQKA